MSEARSGIGVKRQAVTDAIFTMLSTNIKNVVWSKFFKGFQRGLGITGSVVCDHIEYEYDAKAQCLATALYTIIVADPDNLDTVDTIADSVFDLIDCDDLNGTAEIGLVKSINYASAPTKTDAGAVLIVYEVKYYV